MIRIFCFSGTGHSMAVARYFAESLKTETTDITQKKQFLVQNPKYQLLFFLFIAETFQRL